jgi:hypothetical protein
METKGPDVARKPNNGDKYRKTEPLCREIGYVHQLPHRFVKPFEERFQLFEGM